MSRIKPFKTNLDYLTLALDYLKALALFRTAQVLVESHGVEPDPVPDRSDASTREPFHPKILDLRRRTAERKAWKLKRLFDARTKATLAAREVGLPLEDLADKYGLCEFEKLALVAAIGPDLDARFSDLLGNLGGQRRRTREIRTVLDLLCDSLPRKIEARKFFVGSGRLFGNGLLNVSYSNRECTESDFMEMELQVPRRIASMILGEYDVDDQVVSFSSIVDPVIDLDQVVLPPARREEVMELVTNRERFHQFRRDWGFDKVLSYGKGVILLFSGPPGTGKTMLAHALARAAGYRLMLVDIRKVVYHSHNDFEENLQRIFHEAMLQHAIIFFDEADEMFKDRVVNGAMPTLLREFEKLDGICILATNRRQVLDEALDRRILYKLDFEIPPAELREEIWRRHLPPDAPLDPDIDLKALAEEFEMPGGYIKNAVLTAVNRAIQRPAETRRITQADLRFGAVTQRRNRLTAHADKVTPKLTLADVVLPDATMRQIRAFLGAAQKRSMVFSSWGFGRKLSFGRGLAALFVGPPGTGKTMTAEALAGELGQNLYPVRLGSVISKYVGDTEKHLASVFEAAREAQALLFFDEADAFFGARLDEDSHHAHYLNQQTDTLLLEMEKFDGIVILATNRPGALDPAFERRIRYRLEFPLPDAAERERIWRGQMPAEAPVAADLDFSWLAREFAFNGGTIKNVVLRAAFDAATDGRVITMDILRQCALQEQPLLKRQEIGFACKQAS
jgi:SpoVK/Ycf46/Vps4 family AAA+-type ATPase